MAAARRTKVVGIVNITPDSFSDGGLFLRPDDALAHARRLAREGADIVELGAASSNPDAAPVPPGEEIARLAPVLEALAKDDTALCVDSTQPEVQNFAISKGARLLNDIRGFPDAAHYDRLAASSCTLVVMHSVTGKARATREPKDPQVVIDSVCDFFQSRLAQLKSAGVARERIVIDPGMGFFLGSNPEPSLAVLAHLRSLRARFGLPVMVSVSRKSFLLNLKPSAACDIQSRSLAAELFAAQQGADYIRTHAVGALCQGLATLEAISRSGRSVRPIDRA